MSSPFVAEIRIFAFNFAPKGWALCDGQLLPLSQNTALFSLLGTFYGGDGKSTFGLPDLQGSVPIHPGQGTGLSLYDLGQAGGTDAVTLPNSEMPAQTHALQASTSVANQPGPTPTNALARVQGATPYAPGSGNPPLKQMDAQAVSVAGSSLPHTNLMPYL